MFRRDFEQSRLTTQPSISTNSATSPSLVGLLDTTNDGVEYGAGTVSVGTEFPDLLIENVSSVSTLPYNDLHDMEVEDYHDLQDMEESDKDENVILCTITRDTAVESSQETRPVLAETTRPADGPASVLKIPPDLHVESTVEENGAGDGNRRLEEENVDASRILSASDEIETDNLPVVPVSPEIPNEANDDAYASGSMSFNEASSTDIITVSSVENVEFDSCSLAHGQVSNMMSHVDFAAVGGEPQEANLAYPDQVEQMYSKGDLMWISCGICCVNRWKLVFMPCGHASCVSCYKRLTKCHICRNRIRRVVKPLMSI